MSASQRRKGANGELEICRLLTDELGTSVQRRLGAARDGGCDVDIPGWSIEVKRAERFLQAFWQQAVEQAEAMKRRPVLFWRKSRASWSVYVDLFDLAPSHFPKPKTHEPARLSLLAWCQLARELM
jgi:hypothetical protein